MTKQLLTLIILFFSISTFGQFDKATHFVSGGIDIDTWDRTLREFEIAIKYGYYIADNHAIGGEFLFYRRDVNSINNNLDFTFGLFYRYNLHPLPYVFFEPAYLIRTFDNDILPTIGHILRPGLGLSIPIFLNFSIEILTSYELAFEYTSFNLKPYHLNTTVKFSIPFNLKTN